MAVNTSATANTAFADVAANIATTALGVVRYFQAMHDNLLPVGAYLSIPVSGTAAGFIVVKYNGSLYKYEPTAPVGSVPGDAVTLSSTVKYSASAGKLYVYFASQWNCGTISPVGAF